MSYYFSKIVNASFDEAVTKITGELKGEGFGILTEIDLKETGGEGTLPRPMVT